MPSLLNTRFLSELRSLDYRAITARRADVQSEWDLYLVARGELVLGRYEEAASSIAALKLSAPGSLLTQFAEKQLSLFQRRNIEATVKSLREWKMDADSPLFLRGEHQFIIGYGYNLLDEFKNGVRHHRLAADLYRQSGFPGQEGVALFNLCVSFNHLNERELFELSFQQLERLFESQPSPALCHLILRMRAYRKVDLEDYLAALKDLNQALGICLKEERLRDVGGIVCVISYLQIKRDGDVAEIPSYFQQLTLGHQRTLRELVRIGQLGLVSQKDAVHLLARWKKLGIDSVYRLFLIDLLLEKLVKGQDYETLIRIARLGNQLALKQQQALSLVDFRFYEILGNVKRGRLDQANLLLNMYESDAEEAHSSRKLSKSKSLRAKIRSAEQSSSGLPSLRSFSSGDWVLDTLRHRLTRDGVVFSLSATPLVERLLAALAKSQAAIPLGQLFETVYEEPFHPVRHDRRLHSLIDRARRTLGDPKLIVRREGKVGWRSDFRLRLQDAGASDFSIQRRRGNLLSLIQKSKQPITIAELDSWFDCSRRTLQLDLRHLIEAKLIQTTGTTHNRRYFLEENYELNA